MPEKTYTLDTSKSIIFFSRFQPKGDGDGGFRRTAQVAEGLNGLDYTFVSSIDFNPIFYSAGYKETPQYQEYLDKASFATNYLLKWNPRRRDNIAYLHHVSWVWKKILEKGGGSLKVALVDDPIYFVPLVEYLASKGIPIIANCHNIEALSRSQLIDEHQLDLLNYEIQLLSLCSLVITISQEETVFLRNLGINVFFYPYHPVKDALDRMLAIRKKREKTTKGDFLMLGTANNPPTRVGMIEVMKRWNTFDKAVGGDRLFVGGFGSEQLKEFADNEHVICKGALSNEELDEMLSSVKASIVYQGDGSGALTKICEFLLAGVPVIANSHAARSYYNIPGVIEFANIDDISNAAKIVDSSEIEITTPVPPDSNSLLLRIKELYETEADFNTVEVKRLVLEALSAGERPQGIAVGHLGRKKMILEAACEYIRADRDSLAAEHDRIVAERDALATERDTIFASLSWQLTAPLRYIGKFFMRRHP